MHIYETKLRAKAIGTLGSARSRFKSWLCVGSIFTSCGITFLICKMGPSSQKHCKDKIQELHKILAYPKCSKSERRKILDLAGLSDA